ncbi:phenylalanine--tRNA ligase subunit beta [soil metagenome]
MNASLRWLNDFLEREASAREIRDVLTARAATVEAVTPVRADLGEIVIGRVVEAGRHPDAEKLWLTQVDAGSGELLQVVCGAPHVEVGTSYPFAPVGATLPGGVTIEKKKIRGQLSNGMLCSARELGLGTDHTGILALETDAAPGTPFLDATGAGDVRFEIDVLPNRPDLLSHEGLAREIAAALGTTMRQWAPPAASSEAQAGTDSVSVPSAVPVERQGTTDGVRVRIEDVDGCPRYVGTVIRGVTIAPSPVWLAERLEGAGVRSINNVVDVTNFMLHGFGQPMHAFDLARLGGEVVIRSSAASERLETLDGVDRALPPGTTVIAGAEHAQAIAGVIGGAGSEVTESTTDIFLETALFNPRRVRATRKALGVSTDASYRFERHVDPEQVAARAAMAARLIAAFAGGRVAEAGVDVQTGSHERAVVALRPSRVARVLGQEISVDEIVRLLTTVGFEVAGSDATDSGALTVSVPGWRNDAQAEIDLIEEVARLHGYDAFSSELRPFRPTTVADDPMVAVERRVRTALVGAGLMEARPMPFAPAATDERLRLRNPLTENEAYLRESLLEGLARAAEHNLSHMARSVRLFEIGTVFKASDAPRPEERTHAGVLLMGYAEPPHFTNPAPRALDPWDIKWIAELSVSAAFRTRDIKFNISESEDSLPARVAQNLWEVEVGGRSVGRISLLDIDAPVWASAAYALELDITNLTTRQGMFFEAAFAPDAAGVSAPDRVEVGYSPLPVTPAAEIDLALLVPDSVSAAQVEQVLRGNAGDVLEALVLFDEFRGHGVEAGSRSLAWRLTFRHPDRTLRDREIEARKEKLISAVARELGVRARTG